MRRRSQPFEGKEEKHLGEGTESAKALVQE